MCASPIATGRRDDPTAGRQRARPQRLIKRGPGPMRRVRALPRSLPRPGLSGVAVTVAAFDCWAVTLAIEHVTVVVALYLTSGTTCVWHLPSTCRDAVSVIVKVMVDGAWAWTSPPRFLSKAEITHGEPHPDVSTDRTV